MRMNDVATSLMEAISIKYNNLVYEMKSRGEDVIVLSLGEAFFDIPIFDFTELPFPDMYHYSHSRGIAGLRDKISTHYLTRYGVESNSETQILLTAGSKIGIYYALLSLLEPGDEVLLLEPYWVSYTEQVKLVGAVPVTVPIGETIDGLEKFVTDRTRAIIINNPQNPTGRNFSRSDINKIYELASEHDMWLISDEAYSDFVNEGDEFISCGLVDTKFERTIVVNSISKNFGISGWRIGYMISNKTVIDTALKITQHTMTCAPTVLLMYLDRYFDDILELTLPQIAALLSKRTDVETLIKLENLSIEPGDSTFYFFVAISPSRLTSIEFCDRLLADHGVVAVPGIGYGQSCDGYVRISIGTESTSRIQQGLRSIKNLILETS
jgi:aminotransferase